MLGEASGSVEFFASPKRVRVVLGGRVIADSRRVRLLRADRMPPVYYFPKADVVSGVLQESGRIGELPGLGKASFFHVRANGVERPDAAWHFLSTRPGTRFLDGYVAFHWGLMDGWFEEELEVFVHPHDPRKRIDIAPSASRVRVACEGVTIAESERSMLLFETGLPVRYYLPKLDARLELLEPSDTLTYCPYKGEARYYSVKVGTRVEPDICWFYRFPTEASPIATRLAFYQERLEVYVDGSRV